MQELDQVLFDRLFPALLAKTKNTPKAGLTEDEWLETIIGTTILDTSLVLEEKVPVEAFEEPS